MTHLHSATAHPPFVHSEGGKVVANQRHSGVQQGPLKRGFHTSIGYNDANEG